MRPQGLLVNLQPYAEPMPIAVRVADETRAVGVAFDTECKLAEMRASLRLLAELVAEGLFSLREETRWRLRMEYDCRDDWEEYVGKPTCGGVEADPSLLAEVLARPDGRVVTTEHDVASVYERVDPNPA